MPIVQSTTFKYDTAETMGDLFDLKISGDFYTRLSNPTAGAVENKIAALEGGVGAMLTASGQAATMLAASTSPMRGIMQCARQRCMAAPSICSTRPCGKWELM